jgi:hypothetical protein
MPAAFFDSHAADRANQLIFGMDLTTLVENETKCMAEFVREHVEKFSADATHKVSRRLGKL